MVSHEMHHMRFYDRQQSDIYVHRVVEIPVDNFNLVALDEPHQLEGVRDGELIQVQMSDWKTSVLVRRFIFFSQTSNKDRNEQALMSLECFGQDKDLLLQGAELCGVQINDKKNSS